MEKIMTYETIRSFAYVNDRVVKKPIKGVIVDFIGLGDQSMFDSDNEGDTFFCEKGILFVHPYNNPWNWMNKQAVNYTDEILDVLFEALDLPEDLPVVSTGGSMGGLSCLVYTYYAKRTPVACIANCPVCDAPYHYTERPDLPRTMYSALYNETCSLEEALKSISPLHLAPNMPDIPYTIFHCNKDNAVNIDMHSEKLVAALKESGKTVTYHIIPDKGHCDFTPEMYELYRKYLVDAILER